MWSATVASYAKNIVHDMVAIGWLIKGWFPYYFQVSTEYLAGTDRAIERVNSGGWGVGEIKKQKGGGGGGESRSTGFLHFIRHWFVPFRRLLFPIFREL